MESSLNNSSKIQIKRRLVSSLSALWGIKDSKLGSLDPVIELLFEACSTELFKIYNEIESSRVRILQRLARLLISETIVGPKPSHAILNAIPMEPTLKISPALQFLYLKKVPGKTEGKGEIIEHFFSPLNETTLVDGKVSWMITPSEAIRFTESLETESVSRLKSFPHAEPYFIWIGLSVNDQINALKELVFYFDWKDHPDKFNFYKILPYSKWYLEGQELQMIEGPFSDTDNYTAEKLQFLGDLEELELLEDHINNFYKNSFIRINGRDRKLLNLKGIKTIIPEEIRGLIPETAIKSFKDNLIWLKVTFPLAPNPSFFGDMLIALNCFPVINRRMHRTRFPLQDHLNIVPLETQGHFLGMKNVAGTDGKEYIQNKARIRRLQEAGTYLVRAGGIERFDSRNARDYLDYLLELLRDESDAFAGFGQKFLAGMVVELNQLLNKLDQRIHASSSQDLKTPAFLIITPYKTGDKVNAEYWSTLGEEANRIRSGSPLNLYEGTEIKSGSMRLVTSTIGGKDPLKQDEVIVAFNDALTRRNRVITPSDYFSFCWKELGNKLKSVRLKKGVHVSEIPAEGLLRTLDLMIEPNEEIKTSADEWKVLAKDLHKKLEHESRMEMPLRIFVKEAIVAS